MNQYESCPECNSSISINAKRCSCGWILEKLQETHRADHRCAFFFAKRRCPLPGTVCPSRGAWYCRNHSKALDNLKQCEAILIHAEKHFDDIMKENINWRKKLFEEKKSNKGNI